MNQLSYGEYLRVDDLLTLQNPLTEPATAHEHLFIVVHQAHELMFKQILLELQAAGKSIDAGDALGAHRSLQRVTTTTRVLEALVDSLETMTPDEFNAFRSRLDPASGFQSVQFREIEITCGVRNERYLQSATNEGLGVRLRALVAAPTLFQRAMRLLDRRGFPSETAAEELSSLAKMYRPDRPLDLFLLFESMIEMDERFLIWRQHHVLLVERAIGHKRGTGGSSGTSYLHTTLSQRFFPQLWDVRTQLEHGVP